jgi:hypothetical protein
VPRPEQEAGVPIGRPIEMVGGKSLVSRERNWELGTGLRSGCL